MYQITREILNPPLIDMAAIFKLQNEIKNYDWGHPSLIYDVVNVKSDGKPAAELWMGAHPGGSSKHLETGNNLHDLINENPEEYLGKKLTQKGIKQLPFLFKLLAADKALSIQCHPSLETAKVEFQKENEQGIPLSAGHRNYKDDNHKPELIVGAPHMLALCGYRPYNEITELFKKVNIDALSQQLTPDMKELTNNILQLQKREDFKSIIEHFIMKCKEINQLPFTEALAASKDYGHDVGLLFFLVLNLIEINEGQGQFLPAGVLHAYVRGCGIELMANSDNVLRCGLTKKHIDVPQLMQVIEQDKIALQFKEIDDIYTYNCPVYEFRLIRLNKDNYRYSDKNEMPSIIFVMKGECTVSVARESIQLKKGESCYVKPTETELQVNVHGDVYIATVGDLQ